MSFLNIFFKNEIEIEKQKRIKEYQKHNSQLTVESTKESK